MLFLANLLYLVAALWAIIATQHCDVTPFETVLLSLPSPNFASSALGLCSDSATRDVITTERLSEPSRCVCPSALLSLCRDRQYDEH